MITSLATTAPTQFLDIGGTRFAYRRFGTSHETIAAYRAAARGWASCCFPTPATASTSSTSSASCAGSSTSSTFNCTTPLPRRDRHRPGMESLHASPSTRP